MDPRCIQFPAVGMLVNQRFGEQYERAEGTEDHEVFCGWVQTSRMSWPARRPIAYDSGVVQLRYAFRLDGVYLCFMVEDFRKEFLLRLWSPREAFFWGSLSGHMKR